jgi:hypothetical protein
MVMSEYTYPLDFPNISVSDLMMRLVRIQAASSSPFTGKQQVISHQGVYWEAEIGLPPMEMKDARQFIAWYHQLRGLEGSFYLPNLDGNLGIHESSLLLSGKYSPNHILGEGFAPDTIGALKAGDFISISNELKQLTKDVDATSSGHGHLYFEPAARDYLSIGESILTGDAKGVFRLATPTLEFTSDSLKQFGISFIVREVL